MTRKEAEAAFQYADDIWQIALEFEFGVNASCMRYTQAGRGLPGTNLRQAYDNRAAAQQAWHELRGAA